MKNTERIESGGCRATRCCLNKDGHCAEEFTNPAPTICQCGSTNRWTLLNYWEKEVDDEYTNQ